ncbi:hypothetical protein TRFO_34549 [Tritrichomonas foetus]|uniref:Uncharacterized protein n=1 Tax=Tritrichomonas foetus TaxID=1144522 RepID=A0A1J4JL16_9EUKA|nr:hypothetical protein TRFO_34549 [Tritrichomonas foetus]|eukprot:OHS99103.1 hypothetical protein TRFO_34549 [Tritrichomonas foetus]
MWKNPSIWVDFQTFIKILLPFKIRQTKSIMSETSSRPAVSVPSIFLKQVGITNAPSHKIVFPRSFAFFMRTAKKLFGDVMEVRSFFNEDGHRVSSLDDLVPGCTYYVSSLEGNGNELDPIVGPHCSPKKENKIMSKDSYARIFGVTNEGKPNTGKLNVSKNNKNAALNFPSDSKKNKDSTETRKSRLRFTPRQERILNEEKAKEKKKKELDLKTKQFEANLAKHSANKTQKGDEETGNVKEIVSLAVIPRKQIPIPKGNRISQDDTIVNSPSKNKKYGLLDENDESDYNDYEFDDQLNDNDNYSSNNYNNSSNYNSSNYNNHNYHNNSKYNAKHSKSYKNQNSNDIPYDGESQNSRRSSRASSIQSWKNKNKRRANDIDIEGESDKSDEIGSDFNEQSDPGLKSRRGSRRANRLRANSSSNVNNNKYEEEPQDFKEEEEINIQEEEEEENENQKETEDLQKLFDDVLNVQKAFSRNISKALEDLPEYSNSLNHLHDYELSQKCYWYLRGLDMAEQANILPLPSNVIGVDQMREKARSVMKDHRFFHCNGITHRFNLVLSGPQASGKSTFLRVITEELLYEMISTEEWKSTCIFYIDIVTIASYATNFARFYSAMIENIIKNIAWNRPDLTPYLDIIKKQFDDVIIYKQIPKFGKSLMLNPVTQRIAPELQNLINKLSQLWNDEAALTEWIMMVIYLPISVAKILNIPKFIYVLDHFEVGDVMIDPTPAKFSESPTSVYLIDILMYALTQCNFIISCGDQQALFNVMEPNQDDERQIQKTYEFISTINLINDTINTDQQIVVDTEGTVPFIITADLCGGVPIYVNLWEEANKLIDRIDQPKEEEEEENDFTTEELKESLFHLMQKIIKILYTYDDGEKPKFEIINVRRKDIPKQK